METKELIQPDAIPVVKIETVEDDGKAAIQ